MSGDLLLGPGDGDRSVSVSRGQRVVLRLPENATTGYRWSGDLPPELKVERDVNELVETAPGAGGTRLIELVATEPGHYEVALRRGRAWEPGPDDPLFRIEIDVA